MLRTVISLNAEDKHWLDKIARAEQIPMTEVVRRAIQKYKTTYSTSKALTLEDAMNKTSGIWKKGDSVAYVQKLREEWTKK